MIVTLSIIAALIPALFYVIIIYWFDCYEKEPLWLLAAAFLWGAIPSILIASVFNTLLSIPFELLVEGGTAEALSAALIAPPVEETAKGLALLAIFFLWRNEIDSPLDGIIYGAMVGMGFAMVENVFYFVETFNSDGLEAWGINIFFRAVVFGLNHSLFTSMSGLGIAVSRMSKNTLTRFLAPVTGWCLAMFLHFAHNASVSFDEALCFLALIFDWGGVLLMLGIIVWSLVQERSWLRQYLAEEVAQGTLTDEQFRRVSSGRKRTAFNWGQLRQNGFRAYRRAVGFQYLCSKLAYRKHHHELFQDEKSLADIAGLREQLVGLGPTVL
ncbi:MAG: PrsW family intramembrane metalloprotease [Anaerolineales bacterium]|nr:PrsW family intramembrane metalloprotease [Anaerolineales bacterium]